MEDVALSTSSGGFKGELGNFWKRSQSMATNRDNYIYFSRFITHLSVFVAGEQQWETATALMSGRGAFHRHLVGSWSRWTFELIQQEFYTLVASAHPILTGLFHQYPYICTCVLGRLYNNTFRSIVWFYIAILFGWGDHITYALDKKVIARNSSYLHSAHFQGDQNSFRGDDSHILNSTLPLCSSTSPLL